MADAEAPRPTFTLAATREELLENIRIFSEGLRNGIQPGQLTHQQIRALVGALPRLPETQVIALGEKDNFCPICFVPYLAILAEEEMASAMDSPAHPVEELGVTKLAQPWQCGHMFCRRDISKWISDGHASCPMCRRTLLEHPDAAQQIPGEQEAAAAELLALFNRATASMTAEAHALRDFLPSVGVPQAELGELWQQTVAGGGAGPSSNSAEDDDRQQFSGMYS